MINAWLCFTCKWSCVYIICACLLVDKRQRVLLQVLLGGPEVPQVELARGQHRAAARLRVAETEGHLCTNEDGGVRVN